MMCRSWHAYLHPGNGAHESLERLPLLGDQSSNFLALVSTVEKQMSLDSQFRRDPEIMQVLGIDLIETVLWAVDSGSHYCNGTRFIPEKT